MRLSGGREAWAAVSLLSMASAFFAVRPGHSEITGLNGPVGQGIGQAGPGFGQFGGGLGQPGQGLGQGFNPRSPFGQGSGFGQGAGFGQGTGFGQGIGFGQGPSSGFGQGFGQRGGGTQGGGFPGGGFFGLNPGESIQLAAVCTDLFADPPNERTRFAGGAKGRVRLADGSVMPLAKAIESGFVSLRGRSDSFDPARRGGSLLLDLYVGNTGEAPVQVSLDPGTTVTPTGQTEAPLPPQADRLFAVAKEKSLSQSNVMQFAVWAAQGSTREDVEQTNLAHLTDEDVRRVQSLLDQSGIDRKFDRDSGKYEARFDLAVKAMGERATPVAGTAILPNGSSARVEGVRGADGKGFVRLKPLKRAGEYYYSAEFLNRADRRVGLKLTHLVSGRPMRLARGAVLMYPAGS